MLDNAKVASGQNKILRCAIYTRKSHEEGLEQEFNSLDAQREAGEAYIESQKLQGWRMLPDRYDDGGFSGGTMERPALQRLLAGLDAGSVDIIVVYKIDRLSRSLIDFMKMIEVFNEKGVSFVSVTQHFNTTFVKHLHRFSGIKQGHFLGSRDDHRPTNRNLLRHR